MRKGPCSCLDGKKCGLKQVGTIGEEIFNLTDKTEHKKRLEGSTAWQSVLQICKYGSICPSNHSQEIPGKEVDLTII